jgi:hypothetical protein
MSDLQNKFNNFEAEEGDDHIHQSWLTIKPKLPPERKRRFLYYRLTGLAALLILASLPLSVFLLNKKTLTENAGQKNNSQVRNSAPPEKIVPDVDNNSNKYETRDVDPPLENKSNIPHGRPVTKAIGDLKLTQNNLPVISQHAAAPNEPQMNAQGSEPPAALSTQTRAELTAEPENLNVFADVLEMKNFHSPDTENDIVVKITPIIKPINPPNKISVEIFYGRRFLRARLNEQNKEGSSFAVGLGFNYHLNRNLFIPLQVVYTGSQQISEKTETSYREVKQPTSSVTGSQVLQYQKVQRTLTIENAQTYHFLAGMNYTFFSAAKFDLNALLLGEFRKSFYKVNNNLTYSNDLVKHDPSSGTFNPYQNAPVFSLPGKQTEHVSNFGLTPGLAIGYNFHRKIQVFVRGTYHFTLTKPRLMIEGSTYNLKERTTMISAGFRFKL